MNRPAVIFFLLFAMFLGAWVCVAAVNSTGLIPSPREVIASLLANRLPLAITSLTTAKQALLGLGLAIPAAAGIVCMAARFPAFERAIYPFVVMLKATPALAFVPLIMALVGGGLIGKATVAAIISFLPLAVGGLSGIHDIPQPLRDLRRNCQPGNWTFFLIVGWPYSLKGFCLGLELAAPMAVVGAIVSDFIIGGSGEGLGSFIMQAYSTIRMPNVAAGGLVATLLGVSLFFLAHGCFVAVRERLNLAT